MNRRLAFASAVAVGGCCGYGESLSLSGSAPAAAAPRRMWDILDGGEPSRGWKAIFGECGERGEYMDGYPDSAMVQRCREDYGWTSDGEGDSLSDRRADMMSHLYDSEGLWEHVSMVAFSEHYVLVDEKGKSNAVGKPYETFQRQKSARLSSESGGDRPIFGGVVLRDWQSHDGSMLDQKLRSFQDKGIDYVRLECNFGSADDIGGASQLADNPHFTKRYDRLAKVARACQDREMVPLVLLQVPWRESGGLSNDFFERGVQSFASALKIAGVESKRFMFETRPPIGISASQERGLTGKGRITLGLQTGRTMFQALEEAFGSDKLAGFCVAGGSTKGDFPTAMEDDTQNAVRQGMRQYARRQWGYDLCFWEMGAKLMLQPKVGRLWKNGRAGRDAARELFCLNAQDLADEIKAGLS